MISKATIREQGKLARAELGDGKRADYDMQIMRHLQEEMPWREVSRVLVFLPIARQNEIDTWPLLRWLWREQPEVEVYAPRVAGNGLQVVRLREETAVRESDWGIPEPAGEAERPELDLVLVPLLGFDETGQRVGYGKGYYDRLMAEFPQALRVGIGYECLLIREGVPAEDWDVPLHRVVTEKRVHNVPRH